jgi:hypothetical protein
MGEISTPMDVLTGEAMNRSPGRSTRIESLAIIVGLAYGKRGPWTVKVRGVGNPFAWRKNYFSMTFWKNWARVRAA